MHSYNPELLSKNYSNTVSENAWKEAMKWPSGHNETVLRETWPFSVSLSPSTSSPTGDQLHERSHLEATSDCRDTGDSIV